MEWEANNLVGISNIFPGRYIRGGGVGEEVSSGIRCWFFISNLEFIKFLPLAMPLTLCEMNDWGWLLWKLPTLEHSQE